MPEQIRTTRIILNYCWRARPHWLLRACVSSLLARSDERRGLRCRACTASTVSCSNSARAAVDWTALHCNKRKRRTTFRLRANWQHFRKHPQHPIFLHSQARTPVNCSFCTTSNASPSPVFLPTSPRPLSAAAGLRPPRTLRPSCTPDEGMRPRAHGITAVLVLLSLGLVAAAQNSTTRLKWNPAECARLAHLLDQNITVFRKLRDGAKWSAIAIFTVGLFLLGATHLMKTGTLTRRLVKLILLSFLTLVSLFAFAAVIYVRENTLSIIPSSSLMVTWENHKEAFAQCEAKLNRTLKLPKNVTNAREYEEQIVNGPTIGAFWVIGPAFIALFAIWFMLFMLREWHLERTANFEAEPGSSRPNSGKDWVSTSDTGGDEAPPDPESVSSILPGHCAMCNHSLDISNSTELNCYHRVHDTCIFKQRKTVNSKKGLTCPACAKQKTPKK